MLLLQQKNIIQNEILNSSEDILQLNSLAQQYESVRIPFYLTLLKNNNIQNKNFIINNLINQLKDVAIEYIIEQYSQTSWILQSTYVDQRNKEKIQSMISSKDNNNYQQNIKQQKDQYQIIEGKTQKIKYISPYEQNNQLNIEKDQTYGVLKCITQQQQQIKQQNDDIAQNNNQIQADNQNQIIEIFNNQNLTQQQLQSLIKDYNYIFYNESQQQINYIREQCKDNISSKQQDKLQFQYLDSCKTKQTNQIKILISKYKNTFDSRKTNYKLSQINGLSAIHYSIYFNNIEALQLLQQQELLQQTQSRFIIQAKGISQHIGTIVPINSNSLQLAALANRYECFIQIFTYALQNNKLQCLLQQQNEFNQNLLQVLAITTQFCIILSHCNTSDVNVTNQVTQSSTQQQIYQETSLEYIMLYTIQLINDDTTLRTVLYTTLQLAAKFKNLKFIYNFKKTILTNHQSFFQDEMFAKFLRFSFESVKSLIFSSFSVHSNTSNDISGNNNNNNDGNNENNDSRAKTMTVEKQIQQELISCYQLIQLQYLQRKDNEQQKYGSLDRPSLRKHFIFYYKDQMKDHDEEITLQKEKLYHIIDQYSKQKYSEQNEDQQIQIIDNLPSNENQYLDSVVQSQDLTEFLNNCIEGNIQEVIDNFDRFKFSCDKRLSSDKIIHNANCLTYAIINGNLRLIQFLVNNIQEDNQQLYDQQTAVKYNNQYIIFNSNLSYFQALLLAKQNQKQIYDLFDQLVNKDQQYINILYQNKQILKLASIIDKLQLVQNEHILNTEYQLILQDIQSSDNNFIYTICQQNKQNQFLYLNSLIYQNTTLANNEINNTIIEQKEIFFGLLCLIRYNNLCACDIQQNNQLIQELGNTGLLYIYQQQNLYTEFIKKQYYIINDQNIYQQIYNNTIKYLIDGNIINQSIQQSQIISKDQLINISLYQYQKYDEKYEYFEACKHGNIELIKQYLDKYNNIQDDRITDLENEIHQHFSGLMYAICYNNIDVIMFLVQTQKQITLSHNCILQIQKSSQEQPIQLLQLAALRRNQQDFNQIYSLLIQNKRYLKQTVPSISQLLIISNLIIQQDQLKFDMKFDKYLLSECIKYKSYQNIIQIFNLMKDDKEIQKYILNDQNVFNNITYNLLKHYSDQYYQIYQNIIQLLQKCVQQQQQDQLNHFLNNQNAYNLLKQYFDSKQNNQIYSEDQYQQLIQCNNLVNDYQQNNSQSEIFIQNDYQQQMYHWFSQCKLFDQQNIYQYSKIYSGRTYDDRQSNIVNVIYKGFAGIHYSIINLQYCCTQFLLQYEQNMYTKADNIIFIKNKLIYCAQNSNIWHLIVMLPDQYKFNEIIQKSDAQQICQDKNKQGLSVLQLMSMNVFNEINDQLFQRILNNINQYPELYEQISFCVKQSILSQNNKFAKLLVKNAKKIDKYLYKEILLLKLQLQNNNQLTETQQIYLQQYQQALDYACQYRFDNQFKNILQQLYPDNLKEIIEQYLQKYDK